MTPNEQQIDDVVDVLNSALINGPDYNLRGWAKELIVAAESARTWPSVEELAEEMYAWDYRGWEPEDENRQRFRNYGLPGSTIKQRYMDSAKNLLRFLGENA